MRRRPMSSLPVIEAAISATFLGLVAAAAWTDLNTLRIPNRIPLAIVMLFPAHALVVPSADWQMAAVAGAVVFLCGWGLYALRFIGGGDVKLAAAIAVWAGPAQVDVFLAVTAVLGGALALLMASQARFAAAYWCGLVGAGRIGGVLVGRYIPYGVAIAGGAMLTLAPMLVAG